MEEKKEKTKKGNAQIILMVFTFFIILPIPVVMYMKWWSLIYNLFF